MTKYREYDKIIQLISIYQKTGGKNEIIVFLDADIENYRKDIIEILAKPLIEGKVDFVKSTFQRKGGRVTQLVAKPLLNILFPEMYKFSEPLSGMVTGKKSILERVKFEKDYGVDIGILLDMLNMKCTIEEGLIERSFGNIEGNMNSEKCNIQMLSDYDKNYSIYNVETIQELFTRVYLCMDNIIEKFINENIILVTHGGVTQAIECYFNGMPEDKDILSLTLQNCEVRKYNIEKITRSEETRKWKTIHI